MPDNLEDTDESYNLIVENNGTIQIVANQYSGAMRGMSTLAQLVKASPNTGRYAYKIDYAPINITDKPRYMYRGLMLDTSRHFYQVSTILSLLDVMAAAKFNVFHWHIVDDDSFPLELTTFPNVTLGGAF
jgi:hexosaminidase